MVGLKRPGYDRHHKKNLMRNGREEMDFSSGVIPMRGDIFIAFNGSLFRLVPRDVIHVV